MSALRSEAREETPGYDKFLSREACAELDRRVDAILEKRRWVLARREGAR